MGCCCLGRNSRLGDRSWQGGVWDSDLGRRLLSRVRKRLLLVKTRPKGSRCWRWSCNRGRFGGNRRLLGWGRRR